VKEYYDTTLFGFALKSLNNYSSVSSFEVWVGERSSSGSNRPKHKDNSISKSPTSSLDQLYYFN
jgi:hypothetical protein